MLKATPQAMGKSPLVKSTLGSSGEITILEIDEIQILLSPGGLEATAQARGKSQISRRQVAIASVLGAESHVRSEVAGRSVAHLSESSGGERST